MAATPLPRRPMSSALFRPEPVLSHTAAPVDRHTPPEQAAERLRSGETLIVSDRYGTGADILDQLSALLPPTAGADHQARRAAQRAHREVALRLLAPIVEHRPALPGARTNKLYAELYPEHPTFALPLVQVQELDGAWTRYAEGVHFAVLGHRLHPYYGTYVPTRTTHLELFGTWLSQHQGPRARAVDVGTGCGVLAFMLCRAGFEQVLATDVSPNAIESVRRDRARRSPPPPLQLHHGDLLGGDPAPADLIVFNPPWTRGSVEGPLDRALYFEDGLFERFFEQSSARLGPSGRVVVLFSNLIRLVQPDVPHPIEAELERGRLRLVQKLTRRIKPAAGQGGRRRSTRERVEIWELARA